MTALSWPRLSASGGTDGPVVGVAVESSMWKTLRLDSTESKKPPRPARAGATFVLDPSWTQLTGWQRAAVLLTACPTNRPGRNRTCNPRFWRPVLYQLSYGPRNWCC